MKKSIFVALALAAVLSTGCDFVRRLAGRPTSAELEAKRTSILEAQQAAHMARLDSMRRIEKQMADSLSALEEHLLDSLSQTKGTILNPAKLGGLFTTKLEARYCIVVGAFRNRAYAERKLRACNEAGYPATIISFRNGLLAVSVCPSDSLDETLKTLRALRGKGICPQDGWILVNE
jgi:predicted esterase YcpF (UPF0227 family)